MVAWRRSLSFLLVDKRDREEVIAHLVKLVGGSVKLTIDVTASVPAGVPNDIVRIVTENGRTLKFTSQGFERE